MCIRDSINAEYMGIYLMDYYVNYSYPVCYPLQDSEDASSTSNSQKDFNKLIEDLSSSDSETSFVTQDTIKPAITEKALNNKMETMLDLIFESTKKQIKSRRTLNKKKITRKSSQQLEILKKELGNVKQASKELIESLAMKTGLTLSLIHI
eukprot:TRINITY_DN537_c0_g1_i17.p3 TRINITY_DN537_c0_g1~~TRINITY_DN537_c0_g1_i17.p3  ORF type:complete len:151 (+),score=38.22 TRINITY_DN537_c0_g1_i17:67-519(+)